MKIWTLDKEKRARLWEERRKVIEDMYRDHTCKEMGKVLGIGHQTVLWSMRRLGIKRTKEEKDKILIESGVKKAAQKHLEEKRRYELGLPLRTNYHFGDHSRVVHARSRLCSKYGYYRVDGRGKNIYDIYYDSKTKRMAPEREMYFNNIYGINFKRGDE